MGVVEFPTWLSLVPSEMPVSPVSTPMRLNELVPTNAPATSSRVEVPLPRKFPATMVF